MSLTAALRLSLSAVVFFAALVCLAATNEPLVGVWHLDRQEINDEKVETSPLTLEIAQNGEKLTFSFSVGSIVRMTYALKLDGSEADVKNEKGEKIGVVQMERTGPGQYKILLKRAERHDSAGKLSVSADGKTLTSETDTLQSGRPVHSVQLFTR